MTTLAKGPSTPYGATTPDRPGSVAPADGRGGLDVDAAKRTVRAWLACCLGILPLCELFTDREWLFNAWATMLVAVLPAALLRLRWRPYTAQVWLGIVLVVPWLTAKFVPAHAIGGVIPGPGAWQDVLDLFDDVHHTTTNGVAPVHTTHAVVFTLCLVLALLTALVDLLAVVGRHAALAGVPLLIIYTVSGAVPRHPVSWFYFLAAAIGFLMLLSLDAQDEVRSWGRLMRRSGETRPRSALAVSGQRIAVAAIVAAIMLPLVAPSSTTNLIANAFHGGGSGSGSGDGTGFGAGGVAINPYVAMKGQLTRPKALDLFTVTLDGKPANDPFYLRTNVLSDYSDKGWAVSGHGQGERIGTTQFDVVPDDLSTPSESFTARIKISGLGGNAPIFARPAAVLGLDPSTVWRAQDQLLTDGNVHRGVQFSETVVQPEPSVFDLQAAPGDYDSSLDPWTGVPNGIPSAVSDLVLRLTGNQKTPYDRARALSNYFTDPANGFQYSLSTKPGDSGSDLLDFLTNKIGFCQQYAGALGIMLRMAHIPARVVLGYTHDAPDGSGSFTVSTNDAHAWVEAYFNGLGWIPFDTTPNAGLNGGSKGSLPWAPRAPVTQSTAPGASGSARPSGAKTAGPQRESNAATRAASQNSSLGWPALAVLCLLGLALLIAVTPATLRWLHRRRRLRAARHGDTDALWAELSATATDLGYVWSSSRTPRQVVGWLSKEVRDVEAPLHSIATAVETTRYAPPRSNQASSAGSTRGGRRAESREQGDRLLNDLRRVEARLRTHRPSRVRLTARVLPGSTGLRLPRWFGRRH